MLRVENITKSYGKLVAVDNVSFKINKGEICILVGPNGAGKSTLIKSILGLLKHKGKVRLGSYDMESIEARRITGYAPETPILHELLTVREHVQFIASAYGVEDWEEPMRVLFDRFDLTDKQNKLCKELSKGMQQKVSLCCAAIISPAMIFLDEPMIGLDPKAIREFKAMLAEWKARGASVLLSTHIIDSIDSLWDRVIMISKGRIIKEIERKSFEDYRSESLQDMFLSIMEEVS
ncbi:MAG TPA: ABC transporter ATP-binding protein [Clostridiaceae bacterium]|jgi:ABC-2 type transport system ATP-binding protein|nr:ABC transporter ATP-binding protein [Clostridiaceae bacterium]